MSYPHDPARHGRPASDQRRPVGQPTVMHPSPSPAARHAAPTAPNAIIGSIRVVEFNLRFAPYAKFGCACSSNRPDAR